MEQILVYADSLTWGIVPGTRERLPFARRWPGVLEAELLRRGRPVRVVENCLNGRRTVFEDPFKPGRNGLHGLGQVIEMHSPLSLVMVMLGTNDFQSVHPHTVAHAAQGMTALVAEIRRAPIEPGMPVPPVMIVAPPPIGEPQGPIAEKFAGAGERSRGLGEALRGVAAELGCAYVDAGEVVPASAVDGIHLDEPEHAVLGAALAEAVETTG